MCRSTPHRSRSPRANDDQGGEAPSPDGGDHPRPWSGVPPYTRLGEVNGKVYEIAELGRCGSSPPSIVKVFRRIPDPPHLEVLCPSEAGRILAFLDVQAELKERGA